MTKNLKNPQNGFGKFFVLVAGLVVGIVLTVGAGIGMHITDQRPFCGSCHIMNQAAVTHKISTHAELSCNDCHAPHNLAAKLPFKAFAGTRDVYLNVLGKVEMPIMAGEKTRKVVDDNCRICHLKTNSTVASMDVKNSCTACHRNVHHMRMKPVSTRSVGDA
ncbi:MAG: NapC/NirT family cytochrome c [Desulfamplus sp.]|nr:NapC/NirT family cytochrome c [Desulfamplus sp.]